MSVIYDVDKFNAKINSLKVSTTSDVFDIIDPKIAKEKVAFDIYETRKTNLDNLTKEFDAGGKYEKY